MNISEILKSYNATYKQLNEIGKIESASFRHFELIKECSSNKNYLAFYLQNQLIAYVSFGKFVEGVWYAKSLKERFIKTLSQEPDEFPLKQLFKQILDLDSKLEEEKKLQGLNELLQQNLFVGYDFKSNSQAALGIMHKSYEFP